MSRIILTDKKKVRQQHVISDMYLRKFAVAGELFIYEKDRQIRRIPVKKGNPIKECRERDYFEYEVNGQKTDNKIENWLAIIETRAADVYPAILDGSQLNDHQRIVWATFVASLFLRTRKVRDQLAPNTLQELSAIL